MTIEKYRHPFLFSIDEKFYLYVLGLEIDIMASFHRFIPFYLLYLADGVLCVSDRRRTL
jgi:hypothetical protein